MELFLNKLLGERHATRSISTEPLSEEQILALGEAARLAPSCFNKQPWRFLFLQSDEGREKGTRVLASGNQPWASRAPLLVIGYCREKNDCVLPERSYYHFDLGLSVMNMMLVATEMGLVARPMAGFDPTETKRLFELDDEDEPLVILAVGKPSEDEDHLPVHYKGLARKPRERKNLAEIVRRI